MSAVLAALFADHAAAERVRVSFVKDGFPTDRVELTSARELGQAQVVPAQSRTEKLEQHFQQLFPDEAQRESVHALAQGVLEGHAVIVVQPRGEVETRRAVEILEQGGPMEMRERDLENQTLERAASPTENTIIPGVRKILVGPRRS